VLADFVVAQVSALSQFAGKDPELTEPPGTRDYIESRSERSGRSYPQP
jgi:hypothetical protein